MSGDDVIPAVVSIPEAARGLELPFEPKDLVTVNDAIVRIAAIDGEFSWHHHDEDELFLCWEGAFRIETQDGDPVELTAGDIYVVPRGIEHRPVADRRAVILMLERPETLQYGEQRSIAERQSGLTSGQAGARKALELALREAIHLGHRSIGTEHLLLGLVRDETCSAATILAARGADREHVRAEVLRQIAAGGDRPGRTA